jgi:sialidase-1
MSDTKIISKGGAARVYQAFPDACRLRNGDIVAVFYDGYHHISLPNAEYPRGGKICLVRSKDEGRTWSEPQVVYDDEIDNRDPHIAELSDGTLIVSFFSILPYEGEFDAGHYPTGQLKISGIQLTRSTDGGTTWEQNVAPIYQDEDVWACSAPVRELPDGTCILGAYTERDNRCWAGVFLSHDGGKTWDPPVSIDKDSGLNLPAETDVIQLKDGSLYAALRGDENVRTNMHASVSTDNGKSWSPVKDLGFLGHCPYLYRLSTGDLLLTYRGVRFDGDTKTMYTALRVSRDETQTWQGPYVIDTKIGAYPATIELSDGTVLVIYYEEGEGSSIRARRFRVPTDIELLPVD